MKHGTMEISEKTPMILLAGPIFAEMLLNILLNNVDTIMISRYSENAVGAVGNANQMMSLFIIMFGVIAGATGVVVAQYLGAKKTGDMNRIYTLSFSFNLVFGLLVSLFVFIFCGSLLDFLKVDAVQREDAVTYMRIVGGLLFLQAAYNVMVQILRCHGYTRVGMYISLMVNLVNLVGNYIFLYGPLKHLELGVAGVAISTVAARVLALTASVIIFYRYRLGKLSLRLLRPFPKEILVRLLKIGIPSTGENLAYSFYQLVLLSFINPMGAMAVNAKVYCTTLMSFSIVFSNSLAQATQIVTGHLVGAGREEAADKRVMKTLRTSLPVAVGIAALNCLLCPFTLKLFTENTEVVPLVQQTLAVVVVMEIGRTMNLVLISSMKAAGDVLFPVLMGLISMWGIGIGVGYGCGVWLSLGMTGVFLGTTADECARAAVAFIRWRRGAWKGKAVVRAAKPQA